MKQATKKRNQIIFIYFCFFLILFINGWYCWFFALTHSSYIIFLCSNGINRWILKLVVYSFLVCVPIGFKIILYFAMQTFLQSYSFLVISCVSIMSVRCECVCVCVLVCSFHSLDSRERKIVLLLNIKWVKY